MKYRSQLVRAMECIACTHEHVTQASPTEEHHLNLGGKAGQKRRGDNFSIPLCGWHHRGEPPDDMNASMATFVFGPSLARSSKLFRKSYGTDDQLLALTNAQIERISDL